MDARCGGEGLGSPVMQGRLLDLVGEAYSVLDLDDFRIGLLESLRRAVVVDWASLNDVGPRPEDVFAMSDPPVPAELHERFGRHAHENPLVRAFADRSKGDVLRLSDVVSREELHATALYREVYAELGLEHQVAFTLPAPRGFVLGVALSRRREDFTESECSLLATARPHLIQAYRNAREHTALRRRLGMTRGLPATDLRARGLTPREAEVVRLMASGRTNADVAAELGLSARTVQTHLQRAYRKLGVRTRSEAARIAWAGYANSADAIVDPG
jgi:DNA-binding CsgD family transcriptional regulator